MKISKYVALAKRRGYIRVVHTDDGILLGNSAALYKAPELPDMRGEEQIRAVLDIEPGQAKKIFITEDYAESFDDVYGMDLTDGLDKRTTGAKKIQSAAFVKGIYAQALEVDDGELIFYDEAFLAPLSDRFKESEYISLAVRETTKGVKYIVVMDGFEVLAGIMPMAIVTEDYLKELKKFEDKVYAQLLREQRREQARKMETEDGRKIDPDTGEIYEQQTMEDAV